MSGLISSILHGAYGDYYWQATSLKLMASRNPGLKFRLYAASSHRLETIRQFDLSFAESFEPWEKLLDAPPTEFVQYQVLDPDLQRDVISKLPAATRARIGNVNRIYYQDLLGSMPLSPPNRLALNPEGLAAAGRAMYSYGLDPDFFERRPTIAFLWRYRTHQSAIHPFLQPPAEECVRKYSSAFRRLIDDFGCHILVTGMNLVTDESNRTRVDAKYTSVGLDLPSDSCTYLKGLGWAADLEILSRCTAAAGMASGFTEALETHRGGGVVLLDPPLIYLMKFFKYRVRLFGNMTPAGLWKTWSRPHSEDRIYRWLASALEARGVRRR
jgi:hypothetical protein